MKALEDPDLTAEQKQLLNEIQGVRYVVINKQHGGFHLSQEAVERYLEIKGIACWPEENKKFGSLIDPTYWLVSPEHRVGEAEGDTWQSMTQAERQRHNQLYRRQTFSDNDIDRDVRTGSLLLHLETGCGHASP